MHVYIDLFWYYYSTYDYVCIQKRTSIYTHTYFKRGLRTIYIRIVMLYVNNYNCVHTYTFTCYGKCTHNYMLLLIWLILCTCLHDSEYTVTSSCIWYQGSIYFSVYNYIYCFTYCWNTRLFSCEFCKYLYLNLYVYIRVCVHA